MLKILNNFVLNPLSWWALALSALGLEFSALYFQYVMELEPCIMCIYQRVAILAILFAGVIGALANTYLVARLIGFTLWAVGSIWGLQIALEHVDIQQADSFFYTCDIIPNFPSWLPLDEWLPSIFAATGDCGEIAWSFLGYSMPQWMIVVYSIYVLLFAIFFTSRIVSLLDQQK